MAYCEDCGCRMAGGFCTNCDEEVFIAEQYRELEESLPPAIAEAEQEWIERRRQRDGLQLPALRGR